MIWALTWPGPRVIETTVLNDITELEGSEQDKPMKPASCIDEETKLKDPEDSKDSDDDEDDKENEEDCSDDVCLRPTASLATRLNKNHVESERLVALSVCQKSRRHTLSAYRRMEHAKFPEGSFYFNPHRDVIFFSFDFIWDYETEDYLNDLHKYYGDQLKCIRIALVEGQILWSEGLAWYTDCLRALGGVKEILISQNEESQGDDSDDEVIVEEEEESHMEVDESSENDYDEEMQDEGSCARQCTKDIEAKYAEYWRGEKGMIPRILSIDYSDMEF